MQVEYGFELTQDEAKDQQVCEQQTEQCGSSQHSNERWMAAQLESGVVSNASSSRVVQVWLDPAGSPPALRGRRDHRAHNGLL